MHTIDNFFLNFSYGCSNQINACNDNIFLYTIRSLLKQDVREAYA